MRNLKKSCCLFIYLSIALPYSPRTGLTTIGRWKSERRTALNWRYKHRVVNRSTWSGRNCVRCTVCGIGISVCPRIVASLLPVASRNAWRATSTRGYCHSRNSTMTRFDPNARRRRRWLTTQRRYIPKRWSSNSPLRAWSTPSPVYLRTWLRWTITVRS